ncbi:TIGR02301 family protein [Cohaesibacter intestini]|nr:TIGR02301 family protein [Cohaesibacter intestini]
MRWLATGFLGLGLAFCVIDAPKAAENLPPYEQSLRRLSAVVGALMFLDPLCNNTSATSWYEQMAALLDAENADDARRRNITDRFNRAYRTYARTYRSCNSQAAKITEIYHAEGQALLNQLKLKHAR